MTIGWQSLRDSVRLAGTVLFFFYLCVYSWPLNNTGLNWSTYTRIFPNQYLLHSAESLDVELQIQRIYSKIMCIFYCMEVSTPNSAWFHVCKYTYTFFIFYIFRICLIYLYILNFSYHILNILAWKTPWTEEFGRLQPTGVAKELDTYPTRTTF